MCRIVMSILLVLSFTLPVFADGVFLYNKDTGKLRRCLELKGRHDTNPKYKCYDEKDELRIFDLEKPWEPVTVTSICMESKVKGTIRRDCLECRIESDRENPVYFCYDAKNKKYREPKKDDVWVPVTGDFGKCRPIKFGPDGIKNLFMDLDSTIFGKSRDTDESPKQEPEKSEENEKSGGKEESK